MPSFGETFRRLLLDKGADVFGGSLCDSDCKSGVGWNVEVISRFEGFLLLGVFENHLASAIDHVHALSRFRAEEILTGEDYAESLLLAVCSDDTMGDDAAVEVEVRLRDRGDIFEGHMLRRLG